MAPGSARSALAYAITRPGLHRIYPDASKLVGYAGQPDGSLDEITSAAIPRPDLPQARRHQPCPARPDIPGPPGDTRLGGLNVRMTEPYRGRAVTAACRSADPDLCFPISSSGQSMAQEAQAKAICAGCRGRRECLAFALRTHQAHGVWGGLSEQERHLA